MGLLAKLPAARVCVVGDLFLDQWVFVDPKRDEPSLETGLMAHQVMYTKKSPGAAGTVLSNLRALGIGSVFVVSMLGDDGDGFEVLRGLAARGVNTDHVEKSARIVTPTYLKPMFLQPDGGAVEGNRLDFKNPRSTPAELDQSLLARVRAMVEDVDAIVVLDQLTEENTGVVTGAMRDELARIARGRPSLLMFADSRAFIHRFRGMTIKCNNIEAARMTGWPADAFSMEAVSAAMDRLAAQTGRPPFITCGAHGVACMRDGKTILAPAARQNGPIDVCGAGDACSAGIVGALCAGADNAEAAFVGNLAAGVTVRKLGDTGTASPEEILALFDEQFQYSHST
jgi:rfaE bifunctional protein kinase chain/domain